MLAVYFKLGISAKEVILRKFLIFLFILMFLLSLDIQAIDAFSFEPEEFPDSIIPEGYAGIAPFRTVNRASRPEDFSVVSGEKW
jgi:hypothetical protein